MIWLGNKAHPSLPQYNGYHTPTFTAEELIKELQKYPPTTPVGIGLSNLHGHIQGINQVIKDGHGCLVIDQSESCLYDDEIEYK